MTRILLALGAAVLALLAALSLVRIKTDMTAFLPEGETPGARLLLDEARSGAATGLILIGIEGAPAPDLARISRAMTDRLNKDVRFRTVLGGQDSVSEDMQAAWFAQRYLLSPVTTPAAFTIPALRTAMEGVLRQLRSSAAPLAVQFGLADPPGAFLAVLRGFAGASTVRVIEGAWFDASGARALLLARTGAGGMDIPAQESAMAAIAAAFHWTGPGGARLLISGPAVFARDAARAIRSDVERIAVISTILVMALLWWRFRAPLVVAAIAIPVVLSVAAGALVVQAVFGTVHGVALGFGATMLGVSVDYPVLMIGHRKRGEPAPDTRRRIGRAFVLAVVTAVLGLQAMVFSGFPGLAQLGVFAACGLLAAAGLTWFVMPALIVHANLAPVAAGNPAWLGRVEGLRAGRRLGLVPVLAAGALLALRGVPWEGDLAALSPVPAASRALDAKLRGSLGAPDAGQVLMVESADAETILQRQEALRPALEALQRDGAIAGAEYAARILPSQATQRARIAALPDHDTLAARVAAAQAGLPFRPGAFDPFIAAVDHSRGLTPIAFADVADTAIGARLGPLLMAHDGVWRGPVVLSGVTDPARIAATVQGLRGVTYVDVRSELGTILGRYTSRAWVLLALSGAAVLGVLALGLRDAGRVARVLGAVGAALGVTVAILGASGVRLSLIHLVALQLVAGIGLDYALFFARRQLDAEERARTLRTLLTCNGMTLLTFGLLAACQTPLLRDIGVTVAVGAALAMVFAFLFVGPAAGEES